MPPRGPHDWITAAGGTWVDINQPLPPEVTAPDISHLSMAEKRALLNQLTDDLTPPEPTTRQGATVNYD